MKSWLFDGMEEGWCRANTIVLTLLFFGVVMLYGFIERM